MALINRTTLKTTKAWPRTQINSSNNITNKNMTTDKVSRTMRMKNSQTRTVKKALMKVTWTTNSSLM